MTVFLTRGCEGFLRLQQLSGLESNGKWSESVVTSAEKASVWVGGMKILWRRATWKVRPFKTEDGCEEAE